VKRREFIALTGGAAVWPLGVCAQPHGKIARVGFLGLDSERSHAPRLAAFRAGLRDLRWVEGKNIQIEFRWADGKYNGLPTLVEQLLGWEIDVLVTHGTAGALATKKGTSAVPKIITAVSDMLALGLVPNLAQPGGNLTGLSFFGAELTAKRSESWGCSGRRLTPANRRKDPDSDEVAERPQSLLSGSQ
jgi:putative tryptophan/tyrosine transport system substrate-binding protein